MWQEFNVAFKHKGVDLDLWVNAHPGFAASLPPYRGEPPTVDILRGTIDGEYADGDDLASMMEDDELLTKILYTVKFKYTQH